MAQSFLLIDGYNLMHAAGMARRRYGPGDLERARMRFLKFLARNLRPGERSRTTVVFDAAEGPSDVPRHGDFGGMDVQFSERGNDADTVIEVLIAHHSAPRQLRVISSDRRLQQAARRRRARSVKSEDFVTELESRPAEDSDRPKHESPPKSPNPKYSGKLSGEQAEAWLAYFGDGDDLCDIPTDQNEADAWQAMIDGLPDDVDEWPESADSSK